MDGYQLIAATPSHQDAIGELAGHLDSVNLLDDGDELRTLLQLSERSFAREQRGA